MSDHESLIRDVPLLARLPEADLKALASRGRVGSYPAGAVIFREGDPGDALHVVAESTATRTLPSTTTCRASPGSPSRKMTAAAG